MSSGDSNKLRLEKKPRKCPSCGFSPVASIFCGMPAYDEKLQEKMDEGRVVLGGCCIGVDVI